MKILQGKLPAATWGKRLQLKHKGPKAWVEKLGRELWEIREFKEVPSYRGNLECHKHAQGRMHTQKTPKKTFSFLLWLISRLTKEAVKAKEVL